MYTYTVIQWLLFFYTYCFIGWCIESGYVSFNKRNWVNRGFMRGPFLPLYGSGAVMMLLVSKPFQDNLVLIFIAGCIGATILEYITGVGMEALFKVRYWDYSNNKFNFQGHICLGTSLSWGVLTIVLTQLIHKPIEWLILGMPWIISLILVIILTCLIGTDLVISFKAAFDLRDILIKMEKAKEEMVRLQKRLDVLLAVADDAKEAFVENLEERVVGWKEKYEERKEGREERKQTWEERIGELRVQIEGKMAAAQNALREKGMKGNYTRKLLHGNPGMISKHFKEDLEELKVFLEERFKK